MTLSIPADLRFKRSPDISVVAVCNESAVKAGCGHKVDIPDLGALCVFLFEGQYFVIDDTCTHGAASLSDGEVFGDEVECPFHQGAFNFRTGAPTARPCTKAVKTYQVQLCDDQICIILDKSA